MAKKKTRNDKICDEITIAICDVLRHFDVTRTEVETTLKPSIATKAFKNAIAFEFPKW